MTATNQWNHETKDITCPTMSWIWRFLKSTPLVFHVFSSFQEWANAMVRHPSSVCLSVCKLLCKSLLLACKWPGRHQTCTRWTPGCAQGEGQGQRSCDTRTLLDTWNKLLRHWRSGHCCLHHGIPHVRHGLWPSRYRTYTKLQTMGVHGW